MTEATRPTPRIWAVGGGKGGVGKTMVASSLAISLARRGHRTVAVDADFGAANLHTALGMPQPTLALRHFLDGEVSSLDEIACDTPIPELRLVSGARARSDAANPHHSRKQRLLRHLHKLDADEIVIDLSSGSSFNVLDFFIGAHEGLIVATPEPTAIENVYHFIKAAFFRTLRAAARKPYVRQALLDALGIGRARGSLNPRTLLEEVERVDPEAGRELSERARAFSPALVVNRAMSWEDRNVPDQIADDCLEHLGARIRPVGSLELDEAVAAAVNRCEPVIECFPDSTFADDVELVVEQLLWRNPDAPSQKASRGTTGIRRLRQTLGLDRAWVARRAQMKSMAEAAAAD